ncbi:LLM class flavin-dependent oxidoreductase [Ginsengibacter hankyongi]|uniref:Luciferase-like monooxygenase n=1 Tax=Ginsengibacter hankyongi TaxID=2607284 RepID=A0A5J5ICL7_9BACT|nr:LLM class flavin-dependent oxidoreductase [Ginsengibacter hankyongi]KAA9036328.1 LLM class flavin-dependent oxidoreductase [Ginsengibacter hankyongi]
MKKQLSEIPVSVLDLATIVEGDSPKDSFIKSLQVAKRAEQLGYNRYWFAEHHNMPNIASSATSVLIGYIAGNTSEIRVGSGGVMLPNHAPLIIAEQFGTLASLYPGRIDLGLGRAPGTDQITSYALRRNLSGSVDDFPRDVIELKNYLAPHTNDAKVRAIPGEGTQVPIWLLGSSTYSAQLAAALGLPFAFASHFAPSHLHDALKLYLKGFTPSDQLQQPYSLACVNVIAADTDEEADYLASSFYQLASGIVTNKRKPLQPPVKNFLNEWDEYEKAAVLQMMKYTFIGSAATVKKGLQSFLEDTQVDEIMVASYVYDNNAKIHSYELIGEFFKKRAL